MSVYMMVVGNSEKIYVNTCKFRVKFGEHILCCIYSISYKKHANRRMIFEKDGSD